MTPTRRPAPTRSTTTRATTARATTTRATTTRAATTRAAATRGRRVGPVTRTRAPRLRPETTRRAALHVTAARAHLRRFRKASILTVALTGLLLLFFAPTSPDPVLAQEPPAAASPDASPEDTPGDAPSPPRRAPVVQQDGEGRAEAIARATEEEARYTFQSLLESLYGALPRLAVALGVLVLAWILVRLLRALLSRILQGWERASATTAMVGIGVWLLAVGVSVSVLAGDIRGLVGSVGLVGLALSWALQRPIESFTGWLLNSFQGYYRVGDRIAVGEVFGDVYAIDFLTTTVWEIGGPDRSGYVHAEQPTGRLITLPNSEVLTGSVMNLTRDFPYVWDELTVPLAGESDLAYAVDLLCGVATGVLGASMAEPAEAYEKILRRAGLELGVPREPRVFVSLGEWSTDVSIRYLVHARERRATKSELVLRVSAALAEPENAARVVAALPRRQIQLLGEDGRPREPAPAPSGAEGAG